MMRKLALAGLFTTALVGLAGCGGAPKIEPAPLSSFTPTLKTSIAWSVSVGVPIKNDQGQSQFSPAVSQDSVTAASAAGVVTRVSLSSGKTAWRVDIGAPIIAGVAVGSGASQGMSAVVSDRNELVILTPEGKVHRRIGLGGVALEIPALMGNTVIARLTDNRVSAWDIQSGIRRWVVQRTLPPLVLHAQSGLRAAAQPPEEINTTALGAEDLLAGLPGGRLLWINGTTGAVRWESQVVTPRGANEVERMVDILGAPSIHGNDVCVAAYQSVVSCFNAETGRRNWMKDFAVVMPVATEQRFVLVVDSQSRLFALNRSDGETLWSVDNFRYRNLSSAVSWGRAIWVADSQGYLHGVARETGKLLARVRLDRGVPISGEMRVTSLGLVLQTQGGQLMLIRSEG